jgi:2-polyprenyl-6-methoxyphenol hydroxylase-like FAD-dependent oxidoreductase
VSSTEAIVVGAGPGGLATAIALRQAGIEVTVFERQAELGEAGSGLTLWPNAIAALDHLGLTEAVRSVSAPAPGIAIRSAAGRVLDATGPELMRRHFSGGGAALLRAELQRVLADAVGLDRIRTGVALERMRLQGDRVEAWLSDGTRRQIDLLVGADGMRSSVRQAIGGDLPLRYAGYTVWRGVASFDLDDPFGVLSMGRGAQFGLFPMPAGCVYWFASLSVPERSCEVDRDGLLQAFAGWHDPIERVIAATGPGCIVATPVHDAAPFPLRARGRVALVGDAAHPSTPALGQGACQAIEDAVVLGRCVRRTTSIASALGDYERARVGRTNTMTKQARLMGAIGQWRFAPAVWLRDRLIAHTPQRMRVGQLRWMFGFD